MKLSKLLFAKGLKIKNVSPRKVTKSFKHEVKLPVIIITSFIQMIYLIFKYVFTKLTAITKKEVHQEVIAEVKDESVIDFTEYKLKKAK